MFTGIISDVGVVVSRDGGKMALRTRHDPATIAIGASIACDGCCLTVTALMPETTGSTFTVDVSNETLSRTTLGSWTAGRKINLERSLRAGDELGGHMVSGHVDGVARLAGITADGDSRRLLFEAPDALVRFIAEKGSVALDGTSLTVNHVSGRSFGVNIIPHTLTVTTWGSKRAGDMVNLEIDLLARYVARLMEYEP